MMARKSGGITILPNAAIDALTKSHARWAVNQYSGWVAVGELPDPARSGKQFGTVPTPETLAVGCKYGCKVYARKRGFIIEYGYSHNRAYGCTS